MGHTIYENFYLSNEIEDQYNSHLNLQQFCTVDNSLVGTAGMKRKINRYRATSGTEKLAMGEGNTKAIEVSYADREYEIELAQNKFEYYDEQEMTDPMLVPVGVRHMGTDMFNTVNDDVYGEYKKATMVVPVESFSFDGFVDAMSMFNLENLEGVNIFGFVCAADMGAIRKALKDDLKYVESFARNGYVGTVAGVNLYTKKDATRGTIAIATKEAVTMFNKKGTEVEQERDADTRKNDIFSRKYYIVALTDETKAVKLVLGSAALSEDVAVTEGKTYYALAGTGYVEVTPAAGDNPVTKGWYEITLTNF